jgi:DNA-binding NarL/FixJ family response regulator
MGPFNRAPTVADRIPYTRNRPAAILIVDDHPLIREGLALQISACDNLRVCAEASDTDEALSAHERYRPDLVIVDLTLKTGHGLDLIEALSHRDRNLRMLVLSAHDESLFAERALRAGAWGYVNKQEAQTQIIDAIHTVLQGKRYLSTALREQIVANTVDGERSDAAPTDTLTNRELEIFQLIGYGKSPGAIADALHISLRTLEAHRDNIRHKLGIRNGAELVSRAIQFAMKHQ